MSRIDPTSQLAALLRAQVLANTQSAKARLTHQGRSEKIDRNNKSSSHDLSSNPTNSSEVGLDRATTSALRALNPADPASPRRAFRIFMQSEIMRELACHFSSQQASDELVNEVLKRMAVEADLRAQMEEAGAKLLASVRQDSQDE